MAERTLYTAGYLAQLLQVPARELESELDQAGYRSELVINEVRHWGPDALAHLRRHAQWLGVLSSIRIVRNQGKGEAT